MQHPFDWKAFQKELVDVRIKEGPLAVHQRPAGSVFASAFYQTESSLMDEELSRLVLQSQSPTASQVTPRVMAHLKDALYSLTVKYMGRDTPGSFLNEVQETSQERLLTKDGDGLMMAVSKYVDDSGLDVAYHFLWIIHDDTMIKAIYGTLESAIGWCLSAQDVDTLLRWSAEWKKKTRDLIKETSS